MASSFMQRSQVNSYHQVSTGSSGQGSNFYNTTDDHQMSQGFSQSTGVELQGHRSQNSAQGGGQTGQSHSGDYAAVGRSHLSGQSGLDSGVGTTIDSDVKTVKNIVVTRVDPVASRHGSFQSIISRNLPVSDSSMSMNLSPEMLHELSSSGITGFRQERQKEKVEMQGLNQRLANFIEKVHYLDSENQRLTSELESFRLRQSEDFTPIRERYEKELRQARKVIDELSVKDGVGQVKVQGLNDQILRLNDIIATYEGQTSEYREKILTLETKVSVLESHVTLQKNRLESRDLERDSQKTVIEKYQGQLSNMKESLEETTVAQIQSELLAQTKTEEAEFYKQLLDKLELMKPEPVKVSGMDAAEFWQSHMKTAIDEIQVTCNERLQVMQEEADYKLEVQMSTMSANNLKESAELMSLREEMTKMTEKLEEEKKTNQRLNSQITELKSEREQSSHRLTKLQMEVDEVKVSQQDDVEGMEIELNSVMEELKVLTEEKLKLELDVTVYKQKLETSISKLEAAESNLTTAESRIETAELKMVAAESRAQQAESRAQTAESRVDTAESRAKTAESRAYTMESKLETAETKLVSAESRITQAESHVTRLQTETDRSRSVVQTESNISRPLRRSSSTVSANAEMFHQSERRSRNTSGGADSVFVDQGSPRQLRSSQVTHSPQLSPRHAESNFQMTSGVSSQLMTRESREKAQSAQVLNTTEEIITLREIKPIHASHHAINTAGSLLESAQNQHMSSSEASYSSSVGGHHGGHHSVKTSGFHTKMSMSDHLARTEAVREDHSHQMFSGHGGTMTTGQLSPTRSKTMAAQSYHGQMISGGHMQGQQGHVQGYQGHMQGQQGHMQLVSGEGSAYSSSQRFVKGGQQINSMNQMNVGDQMYGGQGHESMAYRQGQGHTGMYMTEESMQRSPGGGRAVRFSSSSEGKMHVQRRSKGSIGIVSVDFNGKNVVLENNISHAQAKSLNLVGWRVQKKNNEQVLAEVQLRDFTLSPGVKFYVWAKDGKTEATIDNEMISDVTTFGAGSCHWVLLDIQGSEKASFIANYI